VLDQRFGRKFRVAASAYRYRVEQQITQTIDSTDDLITFKNSGNVNAQGLEFEMEGKDLHRLDARLSYALQRAERRPGSVSLANSPKHIAQLNLFKTLFSAQSGVGLEMRYMSSRQTLADQRVGGFLLTNLTVIYRKLLPNLDLSASIFNVFDKRYSDPGGAEHISDALLQDGRSFWIRLGYGFPAK
jgi:iron complex outermembrane receptor protein